MLGSQIFFKADKLINVLTSNVCASFLYIFLIVSDNSDWVRDKEYCVFTQSSGHSSSNSSIEDGDDDCNRNDDELFGEHLLPPVLLINTKEQPSFEVDTINEISKSKAFFDEQ